MNLKKILWLLFLVSLLPRQSFAQSLNARFSTSFYSWERHLTTTESENHFRIYQTAQFTVGQLAANKLSFHFYGQASQDIAEDADDDPIPRLYNAYFQWRERKGLLERAKLGRQRIYSGVAFGTIDGVDLNLRLGKLFKVGGFVGMSVPFSNEIEVDNWDDSHAFGFRASTDWLPNTKMLISYMQQNQQPVSYTSPGRYTQRILTFQSLEYRLLGVDVVHQITSKASAYGRFDYDVEAERVRRGQLELRFSPMQKLQLTGEFFHRAPLIPANSIFSVFDHGTTQDFGLRANYQFKPNWFIDGNFGYLQYKDDQTVRFGIGLRCNYGSFGYNFRSGYGGQNNGIYGTLNYPLTAKLGVIASTGFSRYSLFDENADEYTSLSGSFGFNYRADKHFSVDLLGQGLSNRYFDNDFRLFVKANYWFFNKF